MTKKKEPRKEAEPMVSFTIPWSSGTNTNTTSPTLPDPEFAMKEEQKIIDKFVGGKESIVPRIPFHKSVCHCGRSWKCYCDVLNGSEARHSLNYCKGCMVLG